MDPGIAKLLPGTESFNDVAIQASSLIPVGDNYSLLISGDLLQGNSFHPDTTVNTADFGYLARIDNSFLIADNIPSSVGFSFTRGQAIPQRARKTWLSDRRKNETNANAYYRHDSARGIYI